MIAFEIGSPDILLVEIAGTTSTGVLSGEFFFGRAVGQRPCPKDTGFSDFAKYRRGVFTDAMLTRMQDVFRETCMQMEGELMEFNGETNHVHLLVTCPPKLALAHLVGKLKGKSAYVIRKEFSKELRGKLWGDHLWSPSYASVTCGGAPLSIIKQYIEDQERPPTAKGIEISKRENRVNVPGGSK